MANEQKSGKYQLPDLDPVKLRNQLALLRSGKLPWTIKKPIGR